MQQRCENTDMSPETDPYESKAKNEERLEADIVKPNQKDSDLAEAGMGPPEASVPNENFIDGETAEEPVGSDATLSPHRNKNSPTLEPSFPPPPTPPTKEEKCSPPKTLFAPVTPKLDMDLVESQENAEANESRSEIQSIMEQFEDGMGGPSADEVMSPRMEFSGPIIGSPGLSHPPRKSSLEPLRSPPLTSTRPGSSDSQQLPKRTSSLHNASSATIEIERFKENHLDEQSQYSIPQPVLPSPPPPPLEQSPDPDLPFDFHRFLQQLRHRTADPVAKYLKSFLLEFGKKQWMVHEQVKIISDFLSFIAKKMAQCEVWRNVSDAEFDNAREGMEKLVMNRLYSQTFSPAIPPPEPPPPGGRPRRKAGQGPPPGRRGQHQEDVERDGVLAQKVRIYRWVKEEHLDIKPLGDKGGRFLKLAQQELLKICNYRAPRDKVICVLNCCKVIFGFLRNSKNDQSADSFLPHLIYTVLHANPPNLVSNLQYILRFRNQDKLSGEAGYYVHTLLGAISFIESLDRTTLTITDIEFERNVEAAVSEIAEPHHPDKLPDLPTEPELNSNNTLTPFTHSKPQPHLPPRNRTPSPRLSLEHAPGETSSPSRTISGATLSTKSEKVPDDEGDAVAGLLRTIQRPLSTIGRIFSDDTGLGSSAASGSGQQQPPLTPQPTTSQRRSPLGKTADAEVRRSADVQRLIGAEDAAARQASKEAEEARKIRAREEGHVVETLCGMFPGLDREVVVDVVRANEGRIGSAVDACLALSG